MNLYIWEYTPPYTVQYLGAITETKEEAIDKIYKSLYPNSDSYVDPYPKLYREHKEEILKYLKDNEPNVFGLDEAFHLVWNE